MADDAVDMNDERIQDETRYTWSLWFLLIITIVFDNVIYANGLSLSSTQFDMSDKRRSGDICSANWTGVRQ